MSPRPSHRGRGDDTQAAITRLRILTAIAKLGVASPNDVDHVLDDVSLGTISYHVRRMQAKGQLRLVRERPKRGAIEHFYEITPAAGDGLRTLATETGRATRAIAKRLASS